MKRICDFISRYMGVIVLLTAVVALLLPDSFAWVDTIYINPLLGVVMFGMGLTLNPADFKIVFLTPLITWLMAGTFVHVDALSMFFSIVQVVILPIVIGFIIQHYCPKFTSRAVGYLPAFSSLAITFIVGIIVSHNAEKLLTSGLLIILVVMLHNVCGLLLGFSIGKLLKLEYKKCVAISIEVGMQNSGLASSLASLHFAAYPLATIPGAIFSVWHNISGALMARLYASRCASSSKSI